MSIPPGLTGEYVLGIDPGNFESAFALLRRADAKVVSFGKHPNPKFEREIQQAHEDQIDVGCEMVCSYGMAAGASLFETCVQIGRVQRLMECCRTFTLIPRLSVKLSLCKSPQANDSNIRAALIDQFGAPGTKKNPGPTYGISADVWAALAVAETLRRGDFKPYVWSNLRNLEAA